MLPERVPPIPIGSDTLLRPNAPLILYAISAVKRAYKLIYRSGMALEEARLKISGEAESQPALSLLAEFLSEPGRGIIR